MTRKSNKKQDVERAEMFFGWYGFTLIVMLLVGCIWDYGDISVSEFLWWWFGLSSVAIAILYIYILIATYKTIQKIKQKSKQEKNNNNQH